MKRLKLSDAILIGSKIRPKATDYLFIDGKSCALGAAYEAVFGTPKNVDNEITGYSKLIHRFPELNKKTYYLGLLSYYSPVTLLDYIIDKNDNAHWSRERIARLLSKNGL